VTPSRASSNHWADTKLIGQAVGIVMHSARIPADQASDYIHIKSVVHHRSRSAPREPAEQVHNNLNAVLVGGPADGQVMYVSRLVDFINVRRDEALHEYVITDEHEQLAGSMLLIWRHREHV
jgi:hypothetical protein